MIYYVNIWIIFNFRDFKELAIKILNECYSTKAKETEAMITRELTQFPGHTCLSLANCSSQEEFVAHSSVQQLLQDVWTGALKTREVSIFSLLLAMFCPPLIWQFKFRNTKELKKMVHVKDDFDVDVMKKKLQSQRTIHILMKSWKSLSKDLYYFVLLLLLFSQQRSQVFYKIVIL